MENISVDLPEYSDREAALVVFRATVGLAVVISVALGGSLHRSADDIATLQLLQALVHSQQSAQDSRRDVFEDRRLAFEARYAPALSGHRLVLADPAKAVAPPR